MGLLKHSEKPLNITIARQLAWHKTKANRYFLLQFAGLLICFLAIFEKLMRPRDKDETPTIWPFPGDASLERERWMTAVTSEVCPADQPQKKTGIKQENDPYNTALEYEIGKTTAQEKIHRRVSIIPLLDSFSFSPGVDSDHLGSNYS